jgi:hypothetical protein
MAESVTTIGATAPVPLSSSCASYDDREVHGFIFDLGDKGLRFGVSSEAELIVTVHEEAATVIAIMEPVYGGRALHLSVLDRPGWFRLVSGVLRNPGATLVVMMNEWHEAQQ